MNNKSFHFYYNDVIYLYKNDIDKCVCPIEIDKYDDFI